MAMIITE